MAQIVSDNFIKNAKSAQKTPEFRVMISWTKENRQDACFFELNTTKLDEGILKGSNDVVTLYDRYDYTDESRFVKNFEISRKVSNYAWGVVSARAKITLTNRSGRFLLGGELGTNLTTGRPVKIMVGYAGEMITIFTGFLGVPKINIVEGTVEFEAFDVMTFFNDKKSSKQYIDNKNLTEIISQLMNEQGFGSEQYRIGDGLTRKYPFLYAADKSLTDLFSDFARNETALISADENGILNFTKIQNLIKKGARKWNFNYSNVTDLVISESDIINSVKVNSEYYRELGVASVFDLSSTSTNEVYSVPPRSKRSFWFEYRDGVDLAADVDSLDLEFRSSMNGGYVLSGVISTGYNFLDKYKLEVNNTTNATAFLTKFSLFGRVINKFKESPVIIINSNSVEKYGINPNDSTGAWGKPLEYDTSLYGTVVEAGMIVKSNYDTMNEVGQAITSIHSEPNQQFKISNFMVPHLQIGDIVGLNIETSKEDHDCVILGSTIKGGVNANFRQELHLQVIPDQRWFMLDTSKLDSGDILL